MSGSTTIKTEYVDLPICGTRLAYDCGTSICGYKWKTGTLYSGASAAPLAALEYRGENVVMRGTAYPTTGTWVDGDIVYNMGTGSNAFWIRKNGSWVAR